MKTAPDVTHSLIYHSRGVNLDYGSYAIGRMAPPGVAEPEANPSIDASAQWCGCFFSPRWEGPLASDTMRPPSSLLLLLIQRLSVSLEGASGPRAIMSWYVVLCYVMLLKGAYATDALGHVPFSQTLSQTAFKQIAIRPDNSQLNSQPTAFRQKARQNTQQRNGIQQHANSAQSLSAQYHPAARHSVPLGRRRLNRTRGEHRGRRT